MLQPFSREAMLPGPAEHGSTKTRRKHGLRSPRTGCQVLFGPSLECWSHAPAFLPGSRASWLPAVDHDPHSHASFENGTCSPAAPWPSPAPRTFVDAASLPRSWIPTPRREPRTAFRHAKREPAHSTRLETLRSWAWRGRENTPQRRDACDISPGIPRYVSVLYHQEFPKPGRLPPG